MTSARAVVVADPDAESRKRIITIVERAGKKVGQSLTIHEAADGATLEELIDEHDPRLILSEVLLDSISGLELLRKLRSSDEPDARLWVFVTQMNREADKYWALRNGADAYVMRPYEDESLQSRLVKLLKASPGSTGRERLG